MVQFQDTLDVCHGTLDHPPLFPPTLAGAHFCYPLLRSASPGSLTRGAQAQDTESLLREGLLCLEAYDL
jgi:hypothetical protein